LGAAQGIKAMRDHTVRVSHQRGETTLDFAPVFNVAVPFIDRHPDEGRGDKIVIRTTAGERISYYELADRTNRCGNALRALGANHGDRVLMIIKDCPEFFYIFWGAIKAGLVPVPVNTLLRANDYQSLISDSGCHIVVFSQEFATEVKTALCGLGSRPEHCISVKGPEPSLMSLLKAAPAALAPVPARATDECFWLYSSGSTGRPKAAVHLHRDMVVTSQNYGIGILGIAESDVFFSAAKLFFAYGLGNAMTFPLWIGGSVILDDARPTAASVFSVIRDFRPTLFFGVPTLYAAQLREFDSVSTDLISLRLCVSAGEALPPDILDRWQDAAGVPLLDGIGSTEALHIFISNRAGDIRPGCTGRLVPGYAAKIVDETGAELSAGEQGRLLIKGDSIAKYYWNNPVKTAETMIDGWLDTGDIYYQDGSGHFYYCGRNDDMLKVGGIWCSPFEIEIRLSEHPEVLEVALVARADDNGLIKPATYVVLNAHANAGDALREELLKHCKSALAPYKYPRWIDFVEELPKTATGKIQRFKLRQQPGR